MYECNPNTHTRTVKIITIFWISIKICRIKSASKNLVGKNQQWISVNENNQIQDEISLKMHDKWKKALPSPHFVWFILFSISDIWFCANSLFSLKNWSTNWFRCDWLLRFERNHIHPLTKSVAAIAAAADAFVVSGIFSQNRSSEHTQNYISWFWKNYILNNSIRS